MTSWKDAAFYLVLGALIAIMAYSALDRRNDASFCVRSPDYCEPLERN